MRLIKARVKGYRSIIDSGYIDFEKEKTILVGPNEAGKTAILQALQQLNPPDGVEPFNPLRDYPRAKYNIDIEKENINPNNFTVVEGYFELETDDKDKLPEKYKDIIFVYGRNLDNSTWSKLEKAPKNLLFSNIQKSLLTITDYFKKISMGENNSEVIINTIGKEFSEIAEKHDTIDLISLDDSMKITNFLDKYSNKLNKEREIIFLDKLKKSLQEPKETKEVLNICKQQLPKFILFSNYFRINPILNLEKLKQRISTQILDDKQYDYGNICLLKFLGFSVQELSDGGNTTKFNLNDPNQFKKYREQLDTRDYKLNAATIRLTEAIRDVWNPKIDNKDANKLRIKADGQYLKVVVEDELGVEVELNQRSEGFKWMVSFYIVFFAEALDKHKNAILLLDEPGLSLHALKQSEFKETLSKLSVMNQTIFTTHSPFLVGSNELDKVRVVEMINRTIGTKVNSSLTATDSGAMLPLQEALGYDLAQSLFFHKKNLVLEGLTDLWYIEGLSDILKEGGKTYLNTQISLLPANSASKVVYYATILHSQNLKIAALLDSDSAGDLAATQDNLVNALGNKKIIRTKDVYKGEVKKVEIEDILRKTLIDIAREELDWDIKNQADKQNSRPIIDIFASIIGKDFSKYKLAKAFIRWTREHKLEDLSAIEIEQSELLIKKINSALS